MIGVDVSIQRVFRDFEVGETTATFGLATGWVERSAGGADSNGHKGHDQF
jgi:hypothetical protein